MYEIDISSRSKGFKAMPMRTPRKTPEKVMTKRRFSFNHDLKKSLTSIVEFEGFEVTQYRFLM